MREPYLEFNISNIGVYKPTHARLMFLQTCTDTTATIAVPIPSRKADNTDKSLNLTADSAVT